MKPYKFFYSEQQADYKLQQLKTLPGNPHNVIAEVFINGKWVRYSEMISVEYKDSNWDDAVFLGIAPQFWIRIDNIIYDKDLKKDLKELK